MLARLRSGLPDWVGVVGKYWRRLFLAAYSLCAKPCCCCYLARQTVVVCCILYACKVERFALTVLKERLLFIIFFISLSLSVCERFIDQVKASVREPKKLHQNATCSQHVV